MGHEGSAQTCAKDEIVAERVEALGILERGGLRPGSSSTMLRAGSKGQIYRADSLRATLSLKPCRAYRLYRENGGGASEARVNQAC